MNKTGTIYIVNRNEIEDIAIDRSLVEIRNENLSITILNVIGNCFINNIVFIVSNFISAINLILLGHILQQNRTHYELFMTYQIGVSIIDFFGRVFILGLLRYNFEKKEYRKLFKTYLRFKTGLIVLIPSIMIPVSLCSYFIIKLLLRNNLDIYNQSLNKQIYFKFLIFSPIIYFFEILFYLNLLLLRAFEEIKAIISYTNLFIICHLVSCWILLYILKIGILGLTISYMLNTFAFYFFSNSYINNKKEEDAQNFIVIPPKEYIDYNLINILKIASTFSIRYVTDCFLYYILFIATLFTNKLKLIVNIIYLNFYCIANEINKGFYLTFKHYLLHTKESNEEKKKYILVFSLTFFIIIRSVFVILIVFKNILMYIYLINGGNEDLKIISNSIQIIYSFCILFNGIQIILYGFIRGMASASPISNKFIYSFIFLFLCLMLCFIYKLSVFGLWIAVLILYLFYTIHNGYNSIIHFNTIFFK